MWAKTQRSREKRTGVYKLICYDCDLLYIGQTGRAFIFRFNEHLTENNTYLVKSNYAKYIMLQNHKYTYFATNCILLHLWIQQNNLTYIYIELLKNNPSAVLYDQLDFKSHQQFDTVIGRTRQHKVGTWWGIRHQRSYRQCYVS